MLPYGFFTYGTLPRLHPFSSRLPLSLTSLCQPPSLAHSAADPRSLGSRHAFGTIRLSDYSPDPYHPPTIDFFYSLNAGQLLMGFSIIHLIFTVKRKYIFLPDTANLLIIPHGPHQHNLLAKVPLIRFGRIHAVDLQGK
jgi:hypothetical protein